MHSEQPKGCAAIMKSAVDEDASASAYAYAHAVGASGALLSSRSSADGTHGAWRMAQLRCSAHGSPRGRQCRATHVCTHTHTDAAGEPHGSRSRSRMCASGRR